MSNRVRDFLYVDPNLVAQALSQLDLGIFKDWESTLERVSGKEGGGGLSLWGAVNAEAKASKETTQGSSAVLEQTAESYVARLIDRLQEQDLIVDLSAAGPSTPRGTVVTAGGKLTPVDLLSLDGVVDSTSWLFLNRLSDEADSIPTPDSGEIKALFSLEAGGALVSFPLVPDHIRGKLADLLDEHVEVIGIVRKLLTGERQPVVAIRPFAIF